MSIAQDVVSTNEPTHADILDALRAFAESFHALHQSMEAARDEAKADRATLIRWIERTDARVAHLQTKLDTRIDVVWSEFDALKADIEHLKERVAGHG